MCTLELSIKPMNYLELLLLPVKKAFLALWDFPVLKTIFALIVAVIGFAVNENILGVGVLIGLVLIDQFTGVWISLRDKRFSSFSFRNGLIKLLFYFIIIGSFHSLQYLSPLIFGWLKLDSAALSWLALTEVISIVENSCDILHLPFPNWILDKIRLFTTFGYGHTKSEKKKEN